jgi:ribosome-associated protein
VGVLQERVDAVGDREPLSALSAEARAELRDALASARDLEDLPGKWQAAILAAEAEPATAPDDARAIEIRGDTIRLGQLLKLAGIVGGGGEAKALLAEGEVLVNGEPETRRGRQLGAGDVVEVEDETLRVS